MGDCAESGSELTTDVWVAVGQQDAVAEPGDHLAAELPGGERCLVLNVGGTLRALAGTCTHRDLPLDGGAVRGGSLVCPWHRARFDLTTGAATRPASRALKTFDVDVVDGTVRVRERGDSSEG